MGDTLSLRQLRCWRFREDLIGGAKQRLIRM